MIGGKKKEELNLSTILSKVSEYDIFRFYLGHDFELGARIHSPFRKDSNPSLSITRKDLGYRFIDFGDDTFRGGVIDFVRMLHPGMTFNGALERIDKDLCLGIRAKGKSDYKRITKDFQNPCDDKSKSITHLVPRAMTKEELSFWNEYYQDISDLKRDRTYAISKLYLNRKRLSLPKNELIFAYEYGGENGEEPRHKIYRPFSQKSDDKWFPNSTLISDMDGWGLDWETCEKLIITKSRKDYAVIKKIFPHVVGVQNEGLGPFTEDNVTRIKVCSKDQYIAFDSDKPGKVASFRVTAKYGWKHINVPDQYLPDIKDFAKWGKDYNLKTIEDYFKLKRLL